MTDPKDELCRLLDAYRAANAEVDAAKAAIAAGDTTTAVADRLRRANETFREKESDLFVWVEAYFRQVLRPGLGAQFRSSQDTSVRFTAVMNDLFAKVLESRPDWFWHAESKEALRRAAGAVFRHFMIDRLRRRKKQTAIPADEFELLAQARATHFESKHAMDLGVVLDHMATWEIRPEPWPSRARVLQFRYVDGDSYDDIATRMRIPKQTVYRLKEEAIKSLKRELKDRFGGTGIAS